MDYQSSPTISLARCLFSDANSYPLDILFRHTGLFAKIGMPNGRLDLLKRNVVSEHLKFGRSLEKTYQMRNTIT